MRLSFSSIAVQPQNKDQVEKMSQAAYSAKELVQKRYGVENPAPVMQANINQDTVTFSSTAQSKAKQSQLDGLVAFYLKKANIPFKQS